MARKSNTNAWIGVILSAIAIGLIVGIVLVNPNYREPVGNSIPDPKDVAYDHALGKIPKVAKADVTHILVSWKGKSPGLKLKDPNRTEEQAKKLCEEIWQKYQAAKPADRDKVWNELQEQYNEDSDIHHVYNVDPGAALIQEFKDVSLTTEVGFVRITMPPGQYGYHVVRRIR